MRNRAAQKNDCDSVDISDIRPLGLLHRCRYIGHSSLGG
jgi:hypothetical protein